LELEQIVVEVSFRGVWEEIFQSFEYHRLQETREDGALWYQLLGYPGSGKLSEQAWYFEC
jgi:hypothetical protein